MNHLPPNPHLIWFSAPFWTVVIYGTHCAYAFGYRGVFLSLRSGRVKALGKIYRARNKPRAFWFTVLGNAWSAIAGTGAAVAMIGAAASAWLNLSILLFVLCGGLASSEMMYRVAGRALMTGVMPTRVSHYRRDKQPLYFWSRIVGYACMSVLLWLFFLLVLAQGWN